MGTGPTSYLNRELVRLGQVIATDFCPEMLDGAKTGFTHSNLEYLLADNRDIPFDGQFDTIIAINSILPSKREDVVKMYSSAYKATKNEGIFIAVLSALDNDRYIVEVHGDDWEVDWANKTETDTTGVQCVHDPETIYHEMRKAGWQDFDIRIVFLDSPEEIQDIKRLYNYLTLEISPKTGKVVPPLHEFQVLAKKT